MTSLTVVAKPVLFTGQLKDLVWDKKSDQCKEEFSLLMEGVVHHASLVGAKLQEAAVAAEEVKRQIYLILDLAHKTSQGITDKLRHELLKFVLEQINGEPVRKKKTTPHYLCFYEAIRYYTLLLQFPEDKGKRKAPQKIVFSSLSSLLNDSESGDSSDGVLTVKYDFFLFTTISTGENGGGKDVSVNKKPKANKTKELERELFALTIGDGDSTEVRDLKAGALSVVHGHDICPWKAPQMGSDLQKMCSEQLPPVRRIKRIHESDDESATQPQTVIESPRHKKKKNGGDESDEENDGDGGGDGSRKQSEDDDESEEGSGNEDKKSGSSSSRDEDDGGDGSEDDGGMEEGTSIEEDDDEDKEEKLQMGVVSTPSTKSNQSRSQSVTPSSPRLPLTELLELHCKFLPQMIGPIERILEDLVAKGSQENVVTLNYVRDLLKALDAAYQPKEEEEDEEEEEYEEEEEDEEADKGTIPELEAHSFEVRPDMKTRFDVDLTGDEVEMGSKVDGASVEMGSEVDGASSLRENANVLFGAFNNVELRTQLIAINFPMGPVDSKGTEALLCQVPLTGVLVHQDEGMQKSILAKRDGWEDQSRPNDCPIHPSKFTFRFMSDEVAYLSPALFANGLGKEGCSSKLHGAQVEFFDSLCYTLYTGPGEVSKMTRETSKEGFERLVKKSPRKYARLLGAKQVHCFIHGNSHWSLLVLINSEDSSVPPCFLGVDHLKRHKHAIHAHNLNWYYILPFLDVILLILVLLKVFLSFEASNQDRPFPRF